jgi:hypothetical protein
VTTRHPGVSFVVPVLNGARWIRDVVAAIWAQADGRPLELLVVDDGSTDGSTTILRELEHDGQLRIIAGPRRGAAAALNAALREVRYEIVCQVDQDVVLGPGWMTRLVEQFEDARVAAAQGQYVAARGASLSALVMGFDLEERYAAIEGNEVTHVCTGNSAYRVEALRRVGLFDEQFGYGYDNDMSYRLRQAGYRLVFCRDARSVHLWRDGLLGYCAQQYGFGYGRLDLVAKHPTYVTGDSVSPTVMMLHPPLTGLALAGLASGAMASGETARVLFVGSTTIIGALALERTFVGLRAARRFRTPVPLLFPIFHLMRDLAWVSAVVVWSLRRLSGRQPHPTHSMRPRTGVPRSAGCSDGGQEADEAGYRSSPPEPNRPTA